MKKRPSPKGPRRAARSGDPNSERLARILSYIDEIVYEVEVGPDPLRSHVLFVSDAARRVLGWDPKEFQANAGLWISLVHPDDREVVAQGTRQLYERKVAGERRYRLRHKHTGKYRLMADRLRPQVDANGHVITWYGAARDITEVEALDEQLRFHASILSNVTDSVIVTDPEGQITYWNDGATAIFGYEAAEMLGKTPATLYPDQDPAALAADLERIMAGEDYVGEWRGRRKDGTSVWLDVKTTPMRNVSGQLTGFIGVAKDATRRKDIEESLRASEARFAAAFAQSPNPLIISTAAGLITEVNDAVCQLSGFTREELIGRTGVEVGLWPSAAARAAWAQRLNERGSVQGEELQFVAKHGESLTALVSATIVHVRGEPLILTQALDITERKKTEERLRAAEENYRRLAELIPDGIWVTDDASDIISANGVICRELWYSMEEICRLNLLDTYAPEDEALFHERRKALLRDGKFLVERRVRRKDGSLFLAEVHSMRWADGISAAVIRNLSDRQRAEHRLKESEERFRRIFEDGPLGMAIVEGSYRFAAANHRLCEMLGYDEDELKCMTVAQVTHPDDVASDLELAQRVFRGAIPFYQISKRYLTASGAVLWADLTASAIRDASGRVLYGLAMIQDITERRQAEQALEESRSELRRLSHQLLQAQEAERSRIARELHDQIGQVLTAIKLSFQGLSEGTKSARSAHELEDAARLIEEAIEQVSSLSFDLRPASLDVLGLASTLAAHARRQAAKAGLELRLSLAEVRRVMTAEAATACFRIAQEAITNVIRHARARHLEVALAEETGAVVLVVSDDGIGFAAQVRHTARRAPGLGLLGMRERAEALGGSLEVEGRTGGGTTVRARIPLGGAS